MNPQILIERFRQYYGHTDFKDSRYIPDEYAYKFNRGREMHEWLSQAALSRLIEQKQYSEICHRVVRSFTMTSGALARWDEYQWVRKLDVEEQRDFALALEQFLYGETAFGERLNQFVAEATTVYRRFRNRDSEPHKFYKANKLSWPFVSYFHFMMWPDQEYVFIKPMPLRESARVADFDIQYDPWPNFATYRQVQEFYRQLWPTVKALGGRDWIDVQTLIHVAGSGFGVPEGGWLDQQKIAGEEWRNKLQVWLQDNPKTMPEDLQRLRAEFVQRFPKERLGEMTLEQYALGLETSKESFCYWIERQTRELGSILGGSSRKFGVWWHKDTGRWRWNKAFNTESPEEALTQIKNGLLQLIEAVEAGHFAELDAIGAQTLGPNCYSLRAKPLYLYFPDDFLPISNPEHLRYFLQKFGQLPQGDLHALNLQLLDYLRDLDEFAEFDTSQMMRFLYDTFSPSEAAPEPEPEEEVEGESLQPPPLPAILDYIAQSPFIFAPENITNYHLSLLTKPLVILTGLSGTGKTQLTRLYADAVHQIPQDSDNPYYAIIAVRPDWTDHRGLLGYYNPLTQTYEATAFLRFLLRAVGDPAHWYYVCLDEMNLARVEYYFADFLCALESGARVQLHSYVGQSVATQAGTEITSRLPTTTVVVHNYLLGGVLYVPDSLPIPPNLLIAGTVNVDETTHAFSDKVLDRANSIEFNHIDIEAYAARYRERYPDRADLLNEVLPLLQQVYTILEPRYLHFGYRTLDEVLGYLWHNINLPETVRVPQRLALDYQLMQKVLPKLRGDERIQETLEKLRNVLDDELGSDSYAGRKLRWMLDELNAFGSTHFWR